MEHEPTPEEAKQQIEALLGHLQRASVSVKDDALRTELHHLRGSIEEAANAFFPTYEQEMARAEAELAAAQKQLAEAATRRKEGAAAPPPPAAPPPEIFEPLPGPRLREELLRRYVEPAPLKGRALEDEGSVREMGSSAWEEGKAPNPPGAALPRPVPLKVPPPQPRPQASDKKKDIGDEDLSDMFGSK